MDKSLLLILNADRKNRDRIIDFIKNIPDELILLINDRMKLYEEYKNTGEKKVAFLCGEYNTSDNLLYFFEIDTYFNEIDIGYKKSNGYIYEDVFKMCLSLDDDLLFVDNFIKKNIGRIEYDIHIESIDGIYNKKNSSENVYNLVKTPLGYMVLYSKNNDRSIKHYIQGIDVSNITDELNIDDVQNMVNVNKLVRRKRI